MIDVEPLSQLMPGNEIGVANAVRTISQSVVLEHVGEQRSRHATKELDVELKGIEALGWHGVGGPVGMVYRGDERRSSRGDLCIGCQRGFVRQRRGQCVLEAEVLVVRRRSREDCVDRRAVAQRVVCDQVGEVSA